VALRSRNLLVRLGLPLLAAAAVVVLLLHDGSGAPEEPSPGLDSLATGNPREASAATPLSPSARGRTGSDARAPVPGAAAGETPKPVPRLLAGRVQDEAGHPLPGARVSAGGPPVLAGAGGEFQLQLPPRESTAVARRRPVFLEASAPGHRLVSVPATGAYTVLELPADPGLAVRAVRASDEKPVAGARVTLHLLRPSEPRDLSGPQPFASNPSAEAGTDAEGRALLPTPARIALLEIEAPGFAQARLWFRPGSRVADAQGRHAPLLARLRPGRAQEIRIVDAANQPVPGARVGFGISGWPPATADADGRVPLPDLDPERPLLLRIQLPGQRGWVEALDEPWRRLDRSQVACRNRSLEVRLEVESGDRPERYEIASTGLLQGGLQPYVPDPRKEAALLVWAPVPPAGETTLETGWQAAETLVLCRRRDDGEIVDAVRVVPGAPVELRGSRGAALTVRLEGPEPSEVEGWSLRLYAGGSTTPGYERSREAPVHDLQADFRVEPGKYKVDLVPPSGGLGRRLGRVKVEGEPVEKVFSLGGLRTVEGEIVCQGAPLSGALVLLAQEGSAARLGQTWSDAAGRFRLEGAPEGPLFVRVLPNDPLLHRAKEITAPVGREGWVAVEVPAATLEYRASADDAPLLGNLRILQSFQTGAVKDRESFVLPPPGLQTRSVRVAAPGFYRFVLRSDFLTLEQPEFRVIPGDRRRVELNALRTGVVSIDLDRGAVPEALQYTVKPSWVAPAGAPPPEPAERRGALGSWSCAPGEWGLTLKTLLAYGESGPEPVGAGAWSGKVPVEAGRVTRVRLTVADGRLAATVGAPREP